MNNHGLDVYRSMAILGVDSLLPTSLETLTAMYSDVRAELEGRSAPDRVWTPKPGSGAAMDALRARLIALGYTLPHCAARLGVDPWGGVRLYHVLRPAWIADLRDDFDLLVALFLDQARIPIDRAAQVLGSPHVDTLLSLSVLAREDDALYTTLRLLPCYQHTYIITDAPRRRRDINPVMFLWGESYVLAGVVPREPRARALDLCTGSGVHAILASKHCREVTAVDISPRAVQIAQFNAALNRAENVEVLRGDLYEPLPAQAFDLILANPPYNPEKASAAGQNFWSGGSSGAELLARIVQGLPERLAEHGTAWIITLMPNPRHKTSADSLRDWLGAAHSSFDVVDRSAAAGWFANPYVSDPPLDVDTSAYRFGLIQLDRKRPEAGGYRLHDTHEPTFLADGGFDPRFTR